MLLDNFMLYLRVDLLFIIDAGINHFYETPDREWFETDAVLRVSLGNFLFFSILSLLMVGVKNQKDPRDSLHHGGWMMKVICWCLLVILMFFLPNEIISFYGKLLLLSKSRILVCHQWVTISFIFSFSSFLLFPRKFHYQMTLEK